MQLSRAATDRLAVTLGGTAWELLAQRAAFWFERRWLVIADAHFGKAAAFRARGVPVPQGTTTENLVRLDALIGAVDPQAIVFLGDLFHARESHAPATLGGVPRLARATPSARHRAGRGQSRSFRGPSARWAADSMCETEPWRVGTMAFCHHPQWLPDTAAMAGHLHPAVRLHGRADDTRPPAVLLAARPVDGAAGVRLVHRRRVHCARAGRARRRAYR